MSQAKQGHFAEKHNPERRPDTRVSEAVLAASSDTALSCVKAHRICVSLHVTPEETGFTMDYHEIRLVKCQLGLFGYSPENRIVKPAETVSPRLEDEIRKHLEPGGKISCLNLWRIADREGISRLEAARACETLKIKVTACQLGAF